MRHHRPKGLALGPVHTGYRPGARIHQAWRCTGRTNIGAEQERTKPADHSRHVRTSWPVNDTIGFVRAISGTAPHIVLFEVRYPNRSVVHGDVPVRITALIGLNHR